MPQKTQYDPRVYDVRYIVRFATPGFAIDEQRYYALPGTRTVVAYDANRDLNDCRDAGNLGEQPQAVAFAGGDVWTYTVEGCLIRLDVVAPDIGDTTNRGHKLTEISREFIGPVPVTWLAAGSYPTPMYRVDWLGANLINDAGAERVDYGIGYDLLFRPYGPGGCAAIDAGSGAVLSYLTGFLPQIVAAAYWAEHGRLYFFDGLGRLAIVSVTTFGTLDIVQVIPVPRVLGVQVDARVLADEGAPVLVACTFPYRRAYFFSLANPDLPVLAETRDFRKDPTTDRTPVTALSYLGNPVVFVRGGDQFLDAVDLPVSAARRAGADPLNRVYAHGPVGAVSFAPGESAAKIVGPLIYNRTNVNGGMSGLANGRYIISFAGMPVNPYPFPGDNAAQWRNQYRMPGDPSVIYQVYLRIRGVLEANSFAGSVPVTDPPSNAGYSVQAAPQTRLLRNIRYGNATWGRLAPFGSSAQDFHKLEVSDPPVAFWLAACEGIGTASFGVGDDSWWPTGNGVPFLTGAVPSNTTFTNGSPTLVTSAGLILPGAVGQTVSVDLSAGNLNATNGSPVYVLSSAPAYTDVVGAELWVNGIFAGNVLSLVGANITTDQAWGGASLTNVSTNYWRMIVPAGTVLSFTATTCVVDVPWSRATRGPTNKWVISRPPFSQNGDPAYGVPPHNSGVIVLDDTMILNVRGQATIDTLLDFVRQATIQNTRKIRFTNGSDIAQFFDGADVPAAPPGPFFGGIGLGVEDLSQQVLATTAAPATGTTCQMDRVWTDATITYDLGQWRSVTAGSLAASDPLAVIPITPWGGSITFVNGSATVNCTVDPVPDAVGRRITVGGNPVATIGSISGLLKTVTLEEPWTGATQTLTAGNWGLRAAPPLNNYELMPPDNDPAHPLVIPWSPAIPVIRGVTPLPGNNFIQADILRVSLAPQA